MLARATTAAEAPRSAAESPGIFAFDWRPRPSCNEAAVADNFHAHLDQLLFQARQQLILDRFSRRQRAQDVPEIIAQRMKLEPHSVGCERPAA